LPKSVSSAITGDWAPFESRAVMDFIISFAFPEQVKRQKIGFIGRVGWHLGGSRG
jgi:hypothetical protein